MHLIETGFFSIFSLVNSEPYFSSHVSCSLLIKTFNLFWQGYIQNEIELSHDRNCFDGCGYYSYVNKPGCSNQDSLCKQQPKCNGRVFDCRLVDEDMNICFSVCFFFKKKGYFDKPEPLSF